MYYSSLSGAYYDPSCDPDGTGLIVVGASKFAKSENHKKEAFRLAQEAIVHHFTEDVRGLGLTEDKVCNLFNREDLGPDDTMVKAGCFVETLRPRQLFLYIVSHGHKTKGKSQLHIMLSGSDPEDDKTVLNVEALIERIEACAEDARIFCLVDCCYSGQLHAHGYEQGMSILPETREEVPSGGRWMRGTAILTANNRGNIKPVAAIDGVPGLSKPPFTEALVEILREGIPQEPEYSFGIRTLHHWLPDRINAIIKRANLGSGGADESGLNDESHGTTIGPIDESSAFFPEYSGRWDLGETLELRPSEIRVFRNNAPMHSDSRRQSEEFKHQYKRVHRDLRRQVKDLERQVQDLTEDRETQKKITDRLQNGLWASLYLLATSLYSLAVLLLIVLIDNWDRKQGYHPFGDFFSGS